MGDDASSVKMSGCLCGHFESCEICNPNYANTEIGKLEKYVTWLEKELMHYSLRIHNKSSLESIRLAYERRSKK